MVFYEPQRRDNEKTMRTIQIQVKSSEAGEVYKWEKSNNTYSEKKLIAFTVTEQA